MAKLTKTQLGRTKRSKTKSFRFNEADVDKELGINGIPILIFRNHFLFNVF